jgi:phenylalanyl-tRNA synthetase beta chain
MANSLTKPDYMEKYTVQQEKKNVVMLNALSSDLSVMRQSMLFGGLESVNYNINRKNNNLKFFEFGSTYHRQEKGYQEPKHLSLMVSGNIQKSNWNVISQSSDFFYLKGVLTTFLERLGINKLRSKAMDGNIFSEAISIQTGKLKLAEFGSVSKNILKDFGIKQEVFYADINWDNVLRKVGKKEIKVTDLAKYPEVKRDLALLLDENVKFIDLYNTAFQSERKLLKEVDLFDVYTGNKLPEGKKSYALSFVLQDENKTLNDKQIDKIMDKLQQTFIEQFSAEIR